MFQKVTIYTDGACEPNPGPGGWAAVLLRAGARPIELSGSEAQTTSNRMEVKAALEALKSLDGPAQVLLCSDSEYLLGGLEKLTAPGLFAPSVPAKAKNADLWEELAAALSEHAVTCCWVEAHVGVRWNERADELASAAIPRAALPLNDGEAIHLFTAASCLSAGTGPGGWAVLLRHQDRRKPLSGHAEQSTAQRLHILAALRGLQALRRPLPVHLYTTSDYLRDAVMSWLPTWRERGWRTHDGKPVRNRDLWEELSGALGPYTVRCHLVREGEQVAEMAESRRLAVAAVRAVPVAG